MSSAKAPNSGAGKGSSACQPASACSVRGSARCTSASRTASESSQAIGTTKNTSRNATSGVARAQPRRAIAGLPGAGRRGAATGHFVPDHLVQRSASLSPLSIQNFGSSAKACFRISGLVGSSPISDLSISGAAPAEVTP